MRQLTIAAALALLAAACTSAEAPREPTNILCLDQTGATRPTTCRVFGGSRLSDDQGVCVCSDDAIPVRAPVCRRGEPQPAEGLALEQARRTAARDGSLVGDSFEGRRMCIRSRSERRMY